MMKVLVAVVVIHQFKLLVDTVDSTAETVLLL